MSTDLGGLGGQDRRELRAPLLDRRGVRGSAREQASHLQGHARLERAVGGLSAAAELLSRVDAGAADDRGGACAARARASARSPHGRAAQSGHQDAGRERSRLLRHLRQRQQFARPQGRQRLQLPSGTRVAVAGGLLLARPAPLHQAGGRRATLPRHTARQAALGQVVRLLVGQRVEELARVDQSRRSRVLLQLLVAGVECGHHCRGAQRPHSAHRLSIS